MAFNSSLIEKLLIGSGFFENFATTGLGLTTNIDERYLTALVLTSILSIYAGGALLVYRCLSDSAK